MSTENEVLKEQPIINCPASTEGSPAPAQQSMQRNSVDNNREEDSLYHKYTSMSKSMSDFIDEVIELFETAHEDALPPIQTVDELNRITTRKAMIDPQHLKQIIENFAQQENSCKIIEPYCLFDNKQCYTRNLVFENKYFTLIALCWNPGQASCIHSHGGSQCWAVDIKGKLKEHFYNQSPNEDLETVTPSSITELTAGKCCYIDDGLGIHKIENHTSEQSVSLHLYSPPFKYCPFFHPQSGKRCVGEMKFFSEFGSLAPKVTRQNCTDYETAFQDCTSTLDSPIQSSTNEYYCI